MLRAKLMSVHHHKETGGAKENHSLAAQLKAAAGILEKAVANRALLAGLPEKERMRLLKAAGEIYCPDVTAAAIRESHGAPAQGGENSAGPVQAQ